jgi:circadian clock protein KaiC
VLPITSVALDYGASEERISTGIARLDHMLGGGMFRGSTLMVSGTAGTGKTSLGAHVVNAACQRGEQALMVLLEESPAQVLRNMRSIGLDLRPWVEAGLLRIWAARPSAFGLEAHLAALARLIDEQEPSVAVLDGIASLANGTMAAEVTSSVSRQIDLLKSRGITSVITASGQGEDDGAVSVSAMVDTWLQLRNIEANGERNRLLFVLKSRGTSHSNQVREFVLTDHGVELVDVYIGAAGVLAGSARVTQQAAERDEELRIAEELAHRRRELHRSVIEREAHLVATQDQLDAERTEINRIDLREGHLVADIEADRTTMAARRWADASPHNGETL